MQNEYNNKKEINLVNYKAFYNTTDYKGHKMIINSLEGFKMAKEYGFNAFLDRHFDMDIKIRVEIQNSMFKSDAMFYRYCWNNLPHYCEESGMKLMNYSATFVSHILSRGAYPEMRFDIRNINILTFESHKKWESHQKKEMHIFNKNQKTIKLLKHEYQNR